MNADSYVELKPNRNIPDFRVGDTVRVQARVVEGERTRLQAFEGVVLRIRQGGVNSSFTVRRVSHGVGVERVFPYFSPLVEKVEVVRVGKVRRAKLYYLRDRVGKAARIKPGSRARFEALTQRPYTPEVEEETEEEETPEEETLAAEEGAEDTAVEVAEAVPEPEAAAEASEPEAADEPEAATDGEPGATEAEEAAVVQEIAAETGEEPPAEAAEAAEEEPANIEAPAEELAEEAPAEDEASEDESPA